MLDFQKLQKDIYENKRSKGFNTTDVPFEFCLLQGEISEAFDAFRKNAPNLGEELADIAIYLFGLASMVDIDLESEIMKKVEKNQHREYKQVNGVHIRTKEG